MASFEQLFKQAQEDKFMRSIQSTFDGKTLTYSFQKHCGLITIEPSPLVQCAKFGLSADKLPIVIQDLKKQFENKIPTKIEIQQFIGSKFCHYCDEYCDHQVTRTYPPPKECKYIGTQVEEFLTKFSDKYKIPVQTIYEFLLDGIGYYYKSSYIYEHHKYCEKFWS